MELAILNGKGVVPDDGVYPLNVYVADRKIKALNTRALGKGTMGYARYQ
jgi:hypothetical protein